MRKKKNMERGGMKVRKGCLKGVYVDPMYVCGRSLEVYIGYTYGEGNLSETVLHERGVCVSVK